MAWINPEYYAMRVKAKKLVSEKELEVDVNGNKKFRMVSDSNDTTVSSLSASTMSSKEPSTPMTDGAIHPLTDKLSCCLDHTLDHFAIPKGSNNAKCQLHRWACNEIVKKIS